MRTPDPIEIGGHRVGPGERPFVIAEVSGNHNGSLERALEIVDAIAGTGAQAVKFQTYRADTITIDADGPAFRIRDDHGLWGGRNLYQLYEQAHTPWEWHEPLFARAREHGLVPFSSPFDPTAIELLESLDAPAYKVASAELVDLPLIRAMAATGKPMVISTGMATLAEIDAAVAAAREGGATQVVLLACTASYPADPVDANLQTIPALREAFGVPIGLSDHTPGIGVPVAAVALGAVAIEKHVTLQRADGGVDSDFSLGARRAGVAGHRDRRGTTRDGPGPVRPARVRARHPRAAPVAVGGRRRRRGGAGHRGQRAVDPSGRWPAHRHDRHRARPDLHPRRRPAAPR
jgi:pseudaminic acid synthase